MQKNILDVLQGNKADNTIKLIVPAPKQVIPMETWQGFKLVNGVKVPM